MATYTVTNLNDSGAGSLRQAIIDANKTAGADTIAFQAGLTGTVTLTTGELAITNDIAIDGDTNGDNKADITISGNKASRIFSITGVGMDVDVNSLTLANGYSKGASGGALFMNSLAGTLDIADTTFSNNSTTLRGGAMVVTQSIATISNSLFTGNSAGSNGGAIYGAGALTMANTTIHGNSANGKGGGLYSSGYAVTIRNSTITGNKADADGANTGDGGGIHDPTLSLTMTNTVVAQNTSGSLLTANDVFGPVDTADNNFFGTTVAIGAGSGNINNGGDPLLAALAGNGGTVQTRNILGGSPLIDAGSNAGAAGLATDANGNPRTANGTVDIGATEVRNLVVTTASDVIDAKDGKLSLREAVALANAGADLDLITFDAGLKGQTLTLGGTQLTLTNDVAIDGDTDGDNKADITISGDGKSRIFSMAGAAADVDLLSLTLTGGNDLGGGGAVYANDIGTLDILDSTISGSSGSFGGGIIASATAVTLVNSLLTGNSAANNGGGIFVQAGSTLAVTNSTIHANTADGFGGGISALYSAVTLLNSTVTGNQASANSAAYNSGGGIDDLKSTTITVTNSVVAENTSGTGKSANDVNGTIDTATNSFFGTAATITSNTASTVNGGSPGLGALQDNGGAVFTRDLLTDSQLRDQGNSAAAGLPAEDANGNPRIKGSAVDIGATEFQSDTLVVTTAADTVALDGQLSLREAIAIANKHAGADTITFDASLAGSTITLGGAELALTSDVTIDGDTDGDDKADITISGNKASRVFTMTGAATDVDLKSLTLTGGKAIGIDGGAIYAENIGTLDILGATISDSTTSTLGGGLRAVGSDVTLVNSLVTGNNSGSRGGGIYLFSSTLAVTNSTIHGNASNSYGGGIGATSSTVTLLNSTVTGNQADADGGAATGGGIGQFISTIALANSVVAENTSGAGKAANDVFGTINSATNSFFGTAATITSNTASTVNGGSPGLGALQDNGGAVMTRNILADSVLINKGSNASAAGLTTDANGQDRVIAGTVDVGATEFQLVVTTASDVVDANDGLLSLREAVALPNADADADTITFNAGLKGQTLVLAGGRLTLGNELTIDGDVNGDNKADITISGNNLSQIFHIPDGDIDLLSLALVNGNASGAGGNTVRGGAIAILAGTLDILDSTLSGNNAAYGGAIYAWTKYAGDNHVRIANSLFTGNHAGLDGGAIYMSSYTALTVTNTTLHANSANSYGGAIYLGDAETTIHSSTITGNRADANGGFVDRGGGINRTGGSLTISNSIVGENYSGIGNTPNDVNGSISTATNSFFGTAVNITTNVASTVNGGSPGLGELLNNGGAVLTRSPLNGSPLINMGSNASLPLDVFDVDGDGDTAEFLPLDGRGGLRLLGGTVDVGAVEQTDNEVITGTSAANVIKGGDGNDMLFGAQGDDTMTGDAGNDVVEGQAGADKMNGGTGQQDRVSYSTSINGVTVNLNANTATGGHATGDTIINFEHMTGSNAVDSLTGNGGNNSLIGLNGADAINGLDGDDGIQGGAGGDTMDGGIGIDTLSYRGSGAGGVTVDIAANTASGGHAAGDVISNFENLIGSLGNDTLTGASGVNIIRGEKGDDTIRSGALGDTLDGGTGIDTLSYKGSGSGVTVNLAAKTASGGDAAGDSFTRFENLTGSSFDDTLIGSGGGNVISGGAGKDRIDGGGRLDTLTGGGGIDTFVLSPDASSRDTIADFAPGTDKLEINAALFGGGLAAGALDPNAFVTGTKALSAEDRFIYDNATGRLLYDANGDAAGGARLIAVFSNLAAITDADFVIV